MKLVTASLVLVLPLWEGVLGGFPSYSAGYGFVSHGGIGPNGEYLPAVARVKVQKDPYQSHYSIDEEGPTHYKYIRHSSATHPADPDLYQPPPVIGHHHQHHQGIAQAVPIHGGGVISAAGVAPYPVPVGFGIAADPYYGYNQFNQFDGAYAHGGFY